MATSKNRQSRSVVVRVSDAARRRLLNLKKPGESYEDVVARVLDQYDRDGVTAIAARFAGLGFSMESTGEDGTTYTRKRGDIQEAVTTLAHVYAEPVQIVTYYDTNPDAPTQGASSLIDDATLADVLNALTAEANDAEDNAREPELLETIMGARR